MGKLIGLTKPYYQNSSLITTIPQEATEKLCITDKIKLAWTLEEGRLYLKPVCEEG
jgi:hypothetical protein